MIDEFDNCPDTPNHNQYDFDGDGIGDVCDDQPISCCCPMCGAGAVPMVPLTIFGIFGMKLRSRLIRRLR